MTEERNAGRKLVFLKDTKEICIKEYLDARFNITDEDISIFSDGQVLKPSIPWSYIESLSTVLSKGQLHGFYEMYTDEDGYTIEVLEVKNDRIAFSSTKSPEEIMANNALRKALGVVVFEKLQQERQDEQIKRDLKSEGFHVLNKKIQTSKSPYTISNFGEYYAIQEPIISFDLEKLQSENQNLEKIIKNTLLTSLDKEKIEL